MLYLFYNGVSCHICRIFDNDGVERNRKSYYAARRNKIHGNWTAFFNRCYFPVKKTTDIVDIIGLSDISVKINKNIDKTTRYKV